MCEGARFPCHSTRCLHETARAAITAIAARDTNLCSFPLGDLASEDVGSLYRTTHSPARFSLPDHKSIPIGPTAVRCWNRIFSRTMKSTETLTTLLTSYADMLEREEQHEGVQQRKHPLFTPPPMTKSNSRSGSVIRRHESNHIFPSSCHALFTSHDWSISEASYLLVILLRGTAFYHQRFLPYSITHASRPLYSKSTQIAGLHTIGNSKFCPCRSSLHLDNPRCGALSKRRLRQYP
jgi:hypothetical protein